MEIWKDTFINLIPKDIYTVKISSGEQDGLNISLNGEKNGYMVGIDFGYYHLTELLMKDCC